MSLTKTEFRANLDRLIAEVKQLQQQIDGKTEGSHFTQLEELEYRLIDAWVVLKRAGRAWNDIEGCFTEDFSFAIIGEDKIDDEDDTEYGEDE